MDKAYWHKKWETEDIGFHEIQGNVFLKEHFSFLQQIKPSRILVPLCGKTKDISFLLKQGCEVVGVELNELAVKQLFEEMGVKPHIIENDAHKLYTAAKLSVFVGDIFELKTDDLGDITAIYDRAALVALPYDMRVKYAHHIQHITRFASQLILTFLYEQSEMAGPPFSISESQLNQLYANNYEIKKFAQAPVDGGLKGLIPAECLVFGMLVKK